MSYIVQISYFSKPSGCAIGRGKAPACRRPDHLTRVLHFVYFNLVLVECRLIVIILLIEYFEFWGELLLIISIISVLVSFN